MICVTNLPFQGLQAFFIRKQNCKNILEYVISHWGGTSIVYGRDGLAHSRSLSLSTARRALRVA